MSSSGCGSGTAWSRCSRDPSPSVREGAGEKKGGVNAPFLRQAKPGLALLGALLLRGLLLGLFLGFLLCHVGLSPPSFGFAITRTTTVNPLCRYRLVRWLRVSAPSTAVSVPGGPESLKKIGMPTLRGEHPREPVGSANQRFLAPFFLAAFLAAFFFFFFAILPPWNVAAKLGSRYRNITIGGLSRPASYHM